MIIVYDKKNGDIFRMGYFDPQSNTPEGYAYVEIDSNEPFLNHKINLKTKKPVFLDSYDPNAERWAKIRQVRDGLLAQTDYLMVPDYPVTDECRAAFVAYRQALRDITEVATPDDVVFPEQPEVVKKTTASAAPAEDAPKA